MLFSCWCIGEFGKTGGWIPPREHFGTASLKEKIWNLCMEVCWASWASGWSHSLCMRCAMSSYMQGGPFRSLNSRVSPLNDGWLDKCMNHTHTRTLARTCTRAYRHAHPQSGPDFETAIDTEIAGIGLGFYDVIAQWVPPFWEHWSIKC